MRIRPTDAYPVDSFRGSDAREPPKVKSIIRLLGLIVCLSGWIVVAFCVHVVRVPDPANGQQSKLLVVPKYRLGLDETYVDARSWTAADVKEHGALILRLLRADKADELKYLTDPKSKLDTETQLTDELSGKPVESPAPATSRISNHSSVFSH
jgi:hypothetical protein